MPQASRRSGLLVMQNIMRQPRLFNFRYEFDYPYSPAEAAQRLDSTLKKPEWESVVAKVSAERVIIFRQVPPPFYNSFNPIFVGRFHPTKQGTRLNGYFRVHWLVICLLLVFFGTIGYEVVTTFLQPEHREGYMDGWKQNQLRWQFHFFAIALLVPIAGWLFGLPNKKAIIRAIREST